MAFTQDNLYFRVTTPFGKDKLLFKKISGIEMLSGLFEYELEVVSESNNLSFDTIIGKNVTVTLEFEGTAAFKRYINALVVQFVQARSDRDPDNSKSYLTTYRATLRPWLWMLNLTRNCQIFQNMTSPEIIKKVFKDLGFTDIRDGLKGTYDKREYCVQYDETAFSFVSRLMEDDGIFYFFEHTDTKHTLVLADDLSIHQPVIGYPTVRYWEAFEATRPEDTVFDCNLAAQVTTGKYAVDDYHFETPSTDLLSEVAGKTGTMRVYEYQGYQGGFDKTAQATKLARRRIEGLEWRNKLLHGQSYCVGFSAGFKFTLKEHPRTDLNTSYVIRALSLSASLENYSNSFEAIPATVPFRTPVQTAKPRIPGTQTAVVTGPKGEEIHTDKYGRIKVQFHWDQLGKKDETTTCFIRVNQGWAGKAWGRLFLPRIGQEVIVSFINGDPDRPLVTGAVYNAEQTVPYALPDNKTKSTWKTRSSKGGGVEDFNEIYFEDKKGEEKFYVHAQKDMKIMVEHDRHKRVDNDEINDIKMNRTTTIEEKHDTLTVAKGDRIIKVNTGKETHFVKSTRSLQVTGNEDHKNDANFLHEVKGNYTLKVTGNLDIQVNGNITIKSAMNFKAKAGINMEHEAGVNLKIKAGVNVESKAGVMLKNEAGIMLKNKGGVMLESNGGVMLDNKAGVMLTNDGGVLLTDKAGALGEVKAGAILIVKGAIVMIN